MYVVFSNPHNETEARDIADGKVVALGADDSLLQFFERVEDALALHDLSGKTGYLYWDSWEIYFA